MIVSWLDITISCRNTTSFAVIYRIQKYKNNCRLLYKRTKTCMISLQLSCRVNPRHESLHQSSRVCTFPSRTRAWEVLNICHLPHVFCYFALYKWLNHQKSVADIFSFTYINTKIPIFLQKPPHFRGVFMPQMADMWQKSFKSPPFLYVFDNFFDVACRGWDITPVI